MERLGATVATERVLQYALNRATSGSGEKVLREGRGSDSEELPESSRPVMRLHKGATRKNELKMSGAHLVSGQ